MNPPSKRPISYLGQKCVLLYLKSDLRTLLSQHCPSIRGIEKKLEFKIRKLKLEPFCVHLEDTQYQLETIRKYPNGPPFGSFQSDLDQFGVPFKDDVMEYGDIKIKPEKEEVRIEHQNLETLEFILFLLTSEAELPLNDPLIQGHPEKLNLSHCHIKLSDYVTVEGDSRPDWENSCTDYPGENFPNFRRLGISNRIINEKQVRIDWFTIRDGPNLWVAYHNLSQIERRSLVQQLEVHLLPHQHRKNRIPPQFKCFIQLTTTLPNGKKTSEIIEYNQKLHVAMRYLNEKLFRKKTLIEVNHMEFDNKGGILRLPINLKFHLKNLKLDKNGKSVLENIPAILDVEKSFPLESIEGRGLWMYLLDYPEIARQARKMIIPENETDASLFVIASRINQHIHVRKCTFPIDQIINLSKLFDQLGFVEFNIGKCFSFGITCPKFADQIFPRLLNEPFAKLAVIPGVRPSPHFPQCILWPITYIESSELHIFGLEPVNDEDDVLWVLHFKLVEKGLADVLN